jgi:Flp pilus assembly protein TadG
MSTRDLVIRFSRDQAGSYAILVALLLPVLVGIAGLGTEASFWFMSHRSLQNAADSAAFSGATSRASGSTLFTEAGAVTAAYGFANGVGGVTVAVNRPPTSGNYTATANAVEVIVQQPQNRFMSALFGSGQVAIRARAVAIPGNDGLGCVLSLDGTNPGATTGQGSTSVNLINCSLYDNSNDASALTVGGSATISAYSVGVVGGISGQTGITTTNGVQTGGTPTPDPYASVANPTPTGTVVNSCCSHGTATMNPGIYPNGMKLVAGANITLNPGVYYIEGGSGLDVAGGATLTGDGVTLVFTTDGSKYATANINGGATVNLTAPTTGATAGIVIFGDRNMPLNSSFTFNGGSTQGFTGAVYVPKGSVKFAGGANNANGCTQLVANTVTFTGNSNFAVNCGGKGTKPLGTSLTKLVE